LADATYRIETVVSPEFAQNAYVLWRAGSGEALVVDPGFNVAGIEAVLGSHGLKPSAILNTHGHADHIAGNGVLKRKYPDAPLWIGRGEARLLSDPGANLSLLGGIPITSPPADRLVDDGERLDLAGFALEVREIPGHSPGSVVFVAEGAEPPFALVGDVIFAGSVGRTDFPGGSAASLFDGIRRKLFNLPDATLLYPGHGPPTTVGRERRGNPFVGEASGGIPGP
jgi:glyoxylase-like metal-dependent hydrolase (beta-lactamase superfamily II)